MKSEGRIYSIDESIKKHKKIARKKRVISFLKEYLPWCILFGAIIYYSLIIITNQI